MHITLLVYIIINNISAVTLQVTSVQFVISYFNLQERKKSYIQTVVAVTLDIHKMNTLLLAY